MKTHPVTPEERAAMVSFVHASAELLVQIGRAIVDHGIENGAYLGASERFVDAVIRLEEIP